jgi:hypothetical protein
LPAKNQVPLPSHCCLELWGLFTSDVRVSPFCCCFAGMRVLSCTLTWWTCPVQSWIVLSGEARYLFTSVCYMGGVGFFHPCCLLRWVLGWTVCSVVCRILAAKCSLQCGCPNGRTEFCPLYGVTCYSCFVFGFNIHCNVSGQLLRRTAHVGDRGWHTPLVDIQTCRVYMYGMFSIHTFLYVGRVAQSV